MNRLIILLSLLLKYVFCDRNIQNIINPINPFSCQINHFSVPLGYLYDKNGNNIDENETIVWSYDIKYNDCIDSSNYNMVWNTGYANLITIDYVGRQVYNIDYARDRNYGFRSDKQPGYTAVNFHKSQEDVAIVESEHNGEKCYRFLMYKDGGAGNVCKGTSGIGGVNNVVLCNTNCDNVRQIGGCFIFNYWGKRSQVSNIPTKVRCRK
jgi:hypothetical protein